MDEEESRKSTRNRKKRTFGDDFIDPTTSEFTAKPGGSTKRKKEGSQPAEIDFKSSPSPPFRAAPEKESEEIADNISKILARYKKQELKEEREMKRIEENLFGESSRRDSEVKSDRKTVEKEEEEVESDEEDGEMGECDGELCDDPDDKNYRPSRQRRKKPQLTMSGLHHILNRFERPGTPPPAPPAPSVSFSYSAQLTVEEDKKLDEEASALIASIREASTLKILAKRQNGKTASREEREAQDAEINKFMKTAEPEMVEAISRRMSDDSGSSSPPTAVRRSDRRQVVKSRGYSPEPEGAGGGGGRRKSTVTRKSSTENAPESSDYQVPSSSLEPDYDVPSTSDLLSIVEQALELKYEAPPTSELLSTTLEPLTTAAELEESSLEPTLDEAPPIESPLEESKPELISSVEELKPETLLAPSPEEEKSIRIDPQYADPAPNCDYSPRHSPIPQRAKSPPKKAKYPPGSTIETITIVKGPDGRILSKKKVVTKLVKRAVGVPTTAPDAARDVVTEIRRSEQQQQQNQMERIPMRDPLTPREEPQVQEPAEQAIRRWLFPTTVRQQPIHPAQSPSMHDPSMPGPSSSSSSTSYPPPKLFKPTVPPGKRVKRLFSPKRLFLGAEEPIKDLPSTSSGQNRWFTQKRVRSFGRDQLRPFGVNVLGQEIPDPVVDSKDDEVTMERVKDLMKVKKAREEEHLRQKRAMAKKLIFNEAHVYQYMNSEKFKESLESSRTSRSEFNKLLNSPVPLQKVPEFSDSLFHTNRDLYENLERIRDQRLHQEFPKRVYRKEFQERWNEDNTVDCGELEWPEEEKEPEPSARESEREQAWIEVLQDINQRWDGIASKIPTTIECHLCQAEMRLVVRKTKYAGAVREYPVYRCVQKRCQTFRSVRKAFDISGIRGLPALNQDPFGSLFKVDGFVMNEPKVEPIEQILQDVIRRHQEVTGENLEDVPKDSAEDVTVPMGHHKNVVTGNLDFESIAGNPKEEDVDNQCV